MPVKVEETEGRVQYGTHVRLEKRFRPEHDMQPVLDTPDTRRRMDFKTGKLISPKPVVRLDVNGKPVMQEAIKTNDKGEPIHHWVLYKREEIKDGKHPIHKEEDGTPSDTLFDYIWMPQGDGSEAEMRKKAEQLAAELDKA